MKFIESRLKALMPLVVYGVATAINHGANWNSWGDLKNLIYAAITAILVHQVPNDYSRKKV